MARHLAKAPTRKRIRNLVIILLTLCVAASIFVGAVVITNTEDAEYQGHIIPNEMILTEQQWLIPQANGGFLLLSSDNDMETKAVFLTQDGAVVESDENGRSFMGHPVRMFVQNDVLYLINCQADENGEMGSIVQIPLDGSQFANMKEEYLFDNTQDPLHLQTVCVDDTGALYAVATGMNVIVRFYPERMDVKTVIPLSLEEPVIFDGLMVEGTSVYGCGLNEMGQQIIWSGTFSEDAIAGSVLQEGTEISFPMTFLSDTLATDANGVLYEVTADGFLPVEGAAAFLGNAGLDSVGNLVAITAENQISVFAPEDLTSPTAYYRYRGEIRAIACSGGVATILYDGIAYRCVLLRESDFVGDESSVPESSAASGDGESETSSEIQDSSFAESSQEPIHPIESGLDSSDASSEVSSSEDTSSGEEMLAWIISSQFDIDRTANVVILPEGTTLAQFRKTVPLQGATLSAVRYDGGGFSSGKLGTGMTLQLYHDWELVDEITVIVKGDLNGNGAVNSADERLLYQHLTGEEPLVGYFYTASDLDNDGVVDTRDLLLLKRLYQ